MVSDPISDFLTRLRNGLLAKKREVLTSSSKMSQKIAQILERKGYIESVAMETVGLHKKLRIRLRYDSEGKPMADGFRRISRPGLRAYRKASNMPSIRGGMGIAIVSTSRGVMTGREAQEQKVGGEILCSVW